MRLRIPLLSETGSLPNPHAAKVGRNTTTLLLVHSSYQNLTQKLAPSRKPRDDGWTITSLSQALIEKHPRHSRTITPYRFTAAKNVFDQPACVQAYGGKIQTSHTNSSLDRSILIGHVTARLSDGSGWAGTHSHSHSHSVLTHSFTHSHTVRTLRYSVPPTLVRLPFSCIPIPHCRQKIVN